MHYTHPHILTPSFFFTSFKKQDTIGPYPAGLSDWSLKFSFLSDLLNHYGVKLAVNEPSFIRSIDTATMERNNPADQDQQQTDESSPPTGGGGSSKRAPPKLHKTGIPPSLNLRCFFSILVWALQVSE